MRKLHPNGDDVLVVFGQGPVGLMGTVMATALGARVIGVDPVAERRELATRLGAVGVVDPTTTDVRAAVGEWTGGAGADLAYETSGTVAGQQGVLQALRRGGKAAVVGAGTGEPSVNLSALIGKELVLMGSFVMPISLYWDLVAFMLRHDLPSRFRALTTHRFRLSDAPEAFRVAESRRSGKVMFVWD